MRLSKEKLNKIKDVVVKAISNQYRRKLSEIRNVKYYFSEQWSEEEKQERLEQGKPILTFNHIKKFVNWLYGTVKQMNVEIRALPQSFRNETIANIVSGLIRTAMLDQRNKAHIELSTLDGFIRGVGFVRVSPSFEEDPNGKILIKRIDPTDVFWDTTAEEPDLSDARFIFYIERLTEEELIGRYPEKERQIKDLRLSEFTFRQTIPLKDQERLEMDDFISYWEGLLKTAYGQLYPIVHFRERIYTTELAIYNTLANTYINLPSVIEEDQVQMYVKYLNQKIGDNVFKVEECNVKRWRMVSFVGDIVLEYYENPYGLVSYDIIPFFCYRLGFSYQGFVDDLIDPQDEFNFRKSFFNEILKEMPIDSHWIPKGAMTEQEIEYMQDKLKKRKQLIPIRYDFGQPQPIVSDALNKLTALLQYEQLLRLDLKEIGGMVDALIGIVPRKLQSGKAIQSLQSWAVIPFEAIFSNYYFYLYSIANVVWKISKFVYANKKTAKILIDNTGTTDVVDLNIKTEAGTLNQILTDEYEIQLVPVAAGPDEMSEKLQELVMLRQMGVPIPDEFLVMFSKVPFKQQIIQAIQEIKQQLAQQQNLEEGE